MLHPKKLPQNLKKTPNNKQVGFFPNKKIITFSSHIARLPDKVVRGGKLDDLTQRQASCTVPWKKTGKNITQIS